jgi:hypothetical protein
MKNWYVSKGLVYADMYDGSIYVFGSTAVRSLTKESDGGEVYYLLNQTTRLYLGDMDRFFANDLERRKAQLQWLDARSRSVGTF